MQFHNIAFTTKDHQILRGWFYQPQNIPAPVIIMTHGFSALKEHFLAKFAEFFAAQGFCVLVYDNRNFGDSDGEPRFEVDPYLQVMDLQDAITFVQQLPEVLPDNIGLWGTSFSGGHVLQVAAMDKRVTAIVAQVPFVRGHHAALKKNRPELWDIIQKKYAADRRARAQGLAPLLTPVVTRDPEKSAVMKQPDAYEFFTRIPKWENKVTLKSLENAGEYAPIACVAQIAIPVLFIVAEHDTVCPSAWGFEAYEKISGPKKLLRINGEHFSPFHQHFTLCATEAAAWFSFN
jgi:uncharacterized protein